MAAAGNDNAAPRSPAELAYVHERAAQCRDILARGVAWLKAQAGWHELPSRWPRNPVREREIARLSFGGWSPPASRIVYRVTQPQPALFARLPLDNWSAGDNRAVFAAWNEFLDESLDWREAAE
jgi:hypothetical protein